MTTKKIKIGDLSLNQFKKILNRACPWGCKECRKNHNVDYVICQLWHDYDLSFDFTDNMLNQDIEVEYDENK